MSKVTLQAIVIWVILAFVVCAVTYPFYRKGRLSDNAFVALPLLAFYLGFTLTITIIERIPSAEAKYQLVVFWSYKAIQAGRNELIAEVFWNYILFIPIGILLAMLLPSKRSWLAIILGMLMSSGIELTQLYLHRGLFEFDDIIHNTLGTIIGVILFFGGMVGDLAESSLKRTCNVKDSGHFLPGIGGLFDLVDSLIFNSFVFYFILFFLHAK